jgi:CDP-paratose 2-epimerase
MAEAIEMCETITGKPMNYSYSENNRIGDHIWWISDMSKFRTHYPEWTWKYNIHDILSQIHENMSKRER